MLVKALNLLTLQMVDCCLSWGWAQWGALDSVGGLEESKFIVIFPLIGFVYNLHVSQIAFMALDDTKLNLNWSTRRWAAMPGTQSCYLLEVCLLWIIYFPYIVLWWSGRRGGGVVVKLLACGERGPGFDSRSHCYDFRYCLSSNQFWRANAEYIHETLFVIYSFITRKMLLIYFFSRLYWFCKLSICWE